MRKTAKAIMLVESSKFRSTDRQKEVGCNVCLRKMRSSHHNRNMLKHRKSYELNEDEIREEIRLRKKLRETRVERS